MGPGRDLTQVKESVPPASDYRPMRGPGRSRMPRVNPKHHTPFTQETPHMRYFPILAGVLTLATGLAQAATPADVQVAPWAPSIRHL